MESVRSIFFFFVITNPTLVNTLTSDHEKHGESTTALEKKKRKKHVYA